MEINILVFGQLAEITGENTFKFPYVKDTEELNRLLIKKFPQLNHINYQIAVNRNIMPDSTELHDEDTVALLPPFSGG